MRTRILVLALLMVAAALWGETVWEDYLAVRLGKNIEWDRSTVFPSRDGNNLLVWTTTESGQRDMKIAKLDENGQQLWVSPTQTLFSYDPATRPKSLTPRSDSGYALLWTHQANKSALEEYYLTAVSENGELLWESVPINQPNSDWINYVAVLPIQDNRIAAVSTQYDDAWTNWVQVFEADGTYQTTQITMPGGVDANIYNAVNHGDFIYLFYQAVSTNWVILYNVESGFVWEEPIACPATGYIYHMSAYSAPDGSIYIIDRSNNLTVYLMNASGELVWSTLLTSYNEQYCGGYVCDDGSFVVSWLQGSVMYASKINIAGTTIWPTDHQILSVDEYGTHMSCCPDDNDGMYLLYTNINYDDFSYHSKIQHVTSTGELEYPLSGQAMDSSSYYTGGTVNNGCFSFYNVSVIDDEAALTMQTWDEGQQIIPEDARVIDSGLSGWSELLYSGSLGDDLYYACWYEDRDLDSDNEIYLQTFDEDGNIQLEENGHMMIELADQAGYSLVNCRSMNDMIYLVSLEAGYVVVRLFTSEGEMYTPNPILDLGTYITGYPEVAVEQCGDYLSVLWYEHLYSSPSTMHLQRVNENGTLWPEPYFKAFTSPYYFYPQLVGAYIVWRQHNYTDDEYSTRVMLVADGEPAPGWPSEGLVIQTYNDYNYYHLSDAATQDDDLYLLQSFYNVMGYYDTYLCRINANTEMPFGSEGIALGQTLQTYNAAKLVCNDDIYVTINQDGYLYALRYTQNGESVWGNAGLNIAHIPSSANIGQFTMPSPDFFVLTWRCGGDAGDGIDLYFNAFNESGELCTDMNGELLTSGHGDQKGEFIAASDNGFVAVWNDERTSNLVDYGDYSEISAQRFSLPGVGVQQTDVAASSSISVAPNPFNPETTIRFNLVEAGDAELNVYNIRGQLVRTLVNEQLAVGEHSIVWNGRDDSGRACASGVYFCRLQSPSNTQTRKMLLLK